MIISICVMKRPASITTTARRNMSPSTEARKKVRNKCCRNSINTRMPAVYCNHSIVKINHPKSPTWYIFSSTSKHIDSNFSYTHPTQVIPLMSIVIINFLQRTVVSLLLLCSFNNQFGNNW